MLDAGAAMSGDAATLRAKELTGAQEAQLREVFNLYDTARVGAITAAQLREVLATMDVEVETDAELEEILRSVGKLGATEGLLGSHTVTFDDIKAMVRSRLVEQVQSGRYFVLLSLAEAETARVQHNNWVSN